MIIENMIIEISYFLMGNLKIKFEIWKHFIVRLIKFLQLFNAENET